MLKKVALLFVCLWVPFTQAAPQFKENVNYEVIQPVVSAQPEVMEYFSFFCPHIVTGKQQANKIGRAHV